MRLSLVGLCVFSAVSGVSSTERAPAPAAAAHPPALNHVYVVLDAATYAAMRDSRALLEPLGRPDGGLPDYAPPRPDADRIFFRGRQTYLEFFAPDNRFKEPVGKVGLALGHDDADDFDTLETVWARTCGEQKRRTRVEWRRTRPPVPWYDALQCDGTAGGSNLAVWAMAYRPEFLRWQSGTTSDPSSRTARADVLAPRLQAGQGRFDVTGVAIDVSPSLHAKLVAQLEQAGFAREDTSTGTRLRGDDWDLVLRAVDQPAGIVSISLDADPPLMEPLPLGSAHLAQHPAGGMQLRFAVQAED
ncbi:DUF5829 family protein [Pelagerythrobacter rhizovicinus]|uniref:Uncharacterized protein n=1 Tax=Pelagerythrobacter rhizovicinus TaxID=2268576 RepID=A0A4Q2KLI1_9SPHN|nr:DUF5829 family protein [Pelagerythrobacter rhizovicinus]RXZ64332.1 hypothetical protein ETX26_10535 [Pelagerythrobacter rhizovicinus]